MTPRAWTTLFLVGATSMAPLATAAPIAVNPGGDAQGGPLAASGLGDATASGHPS